ncbi:MAG: FHA domain-containing protein [Candidatus Saccharicenans sp.]|jgi:ribosome-associated protein YbcJ (S4-like RNA binding protein)|nr:FHA domain-containing protein [Candidatus Saccharicenans sp.]
MSIFKCKACNRLVEEKVEICPDCGSRDIVRLFFRIAFNYPGVKFPFSAHKTMIVGRDQFRNYGDGYKCMSPEQFQLILSDGGWEIKGLSSAVNPTFLNGEDITDKTVKIKEGDIVKIGNLEITIGFIEEELSRE